MMPKKAILVILDGLGDLPIDGKTPLQRAKKPNIEKLAREGIQGLLSPLGRGRVPGSDTSHLQLLGYSPEKYYSGRGPLEALGAGIEIKEGDIALRANLATADKNRIIDRRAGRISTEEAKKIEKEIEEVIIRDVKVIFKSTAEHRGVVILRGKNLSDKITDSDPHELGEIKKIIPKEKSKEAEKTAAVLNEYSKKVREILEKSKVNIERKKNSLPVANVILLRSAGTYKKIPSFSERFGIRGACIAGGALYKGVAKYIGLDIINVEGATGTKNTNLKAKAEAARKAIKSYDFLFLHVKATDSFSHDGDYEGKTKFIERIDKELIPPLIDENVALIITGDHSTPCIRKEHSGHEVPILIWAKNERSDALKTFDEFSAMKGGLGHIEGKDLMSIILNIIGKEKKYGS